MQGSLWVWRKSYAAAYVHCLVVGEGVLTLPLAVRRETAARRDWRVNPRFCEPQPKGGRGLAIAGLVVSILGCLVLLLMLAYIVLAIVLAGAGATS